MTTSLRRYQKILFSLVALTCMACQRGSDADNAMTSFTLRGKLRNNNYSRIFLGTATDGDFIVRDTAAISPNGEFVFQGRENLPDVFRVSLAPGNSALVVIDKEQVQLDADATNLDETVEVTGSDESALMKQLMLTTGRLLQEQSVIEKKFNAARDAGAIDSLVYYQERFFDLKSAYSRKVKNFMRQHPRSFASSYAAFSMLDEEFESDFLDSMLSVFNGSGLESKYVQMLNQRHSPSPSLAVGAMAPEIDLPQPDGRRLKLSSLKGKYVLIDFWASWCRPCREENPRVVKLYQRFNNKGFEILGVSLDESKDQWTRAIEKDQLPWLHVSDLKGAGGVAVKSYQVEAIPMTVLLDREGRIVELNLRGQALEDKLVELFGKG